MSKETKVRRYLESSNTFDYAIVLKTENSIYIVQPTDDNRSVEHWLKVDCEVVETKTVFEDKTYIADLALRLAHLRVICEDPNINDEVDMYVDPMSNDLKYKDDVQDRFQQWYEYYSNEIQKIL
jgi:hypothetical protein